MKFIKLKSFIRDENTKNILLAAIGLYFGGMFAFGCVIALCERAIGKSGREYKSIASVVNVPYVIGCELFRARWRFPK